MRPPNCASPTARPKFAVQGQEQAAPTANFVPQCCGRAGGLGDPTASPRGAPMAPPPWTRRCGRADGLGARARRTVPPHLILRQTQMTNRRTCKIAAQNPTVPWVNDVGRVSLRQTMGDKQRRSSGLWQRAVRDAEAADLHCGRAVCPGVRASRPLCQTLPHGQLPSTQRCGLTERPSDETTKRMPDKACNNK